ncbi:MAG: GatB/YqeY domain-containing protein [Clostridium sp.]|uniref:GatB/YqeY domain-containing protein n=1 Tax=Clostridium sp. TaxID=1506 RepID=UPI002A855A6F|nr:GatB/YqeY domain-containing protein [Clostridium sp.]MDY5097878.1 GatB/YqeY domain-containing protein [Clostridium sp.]
MPIKERLQEDWKQAMKSKDKFRSSTISLAKSAILLVEKTDGIKLEDEQVIEILAKEVKQRNEAILEFQKGNREDLVESAKAEIEILKEYLPQQLSEEEIKEIVIDVADNLGASSMKDMGRVMAEVRPKIVGRADGRLVSSIVKNYLNNK